VFLQGDSLAMTCCGLGGGSLVNAGVLLPPTVQARRNPRWPEAWEKDWGRNLASASDMLRGQSVPAKFQNSKVMEIVGGGDYEHGQVKLSVNFDVEDFGSARNQEIGKCQACGNCLTGCPYNAKLSNDKTYLAAAVQSAVVPRPFPKFLLKETASYGWQSCYAVLHAAVGMLKSVLGMDNDQDMALNVIGHDDSNGKLTFDKETNRVLFKPPHDPLLPQKTEALKNLAKKLGGVIHTPQYRSLSVHLLGGCIVAPDVSSGVCNPDGQVFDTSSPTGVHQGLYICDASIIPCSVGINPCLTIAAAAEHISRNLVRDLT
ncbi:hypothetical protein M569_08517, partial [Genlisea aurea]